MMFENISSYILQLNEKRLYCSFVKCTNVCNFSVGNLLKITERNSEHVYAATQISSLPCGMNLWNASMNGSPNCSSSSCVPVMRQKLVDISSFFSFMVANVAVFSLWIAIFLITKLNFLYFCTSKSK